MSETSAGSIIGTLRLSITDFESGIAKAQALADNLDRNDVNVKVRADTASAETKLATVAASEAKVDQGNTKLAKSGQDAGKGMGALATAIITLGPAIVPLAAGATGLAVGFGAMGAAGVLSIVGIAREMKQGTTLGVAYTGMVGTLKGDLDTLSHTAAAGVLGPFQSSVASLQTQMPKLNSIIGEFSGITGRTAGALTTGLITAFIALEPLARDVGMYVLNLSTRFAALMSGPGVVSFGTYVQSVFPQVMQSVESIVGAAIRLVAAFAPLGLGTLGLIKTLADVINAIPVDVLSVLATTATSVYIGFKSYGLLSGGVRGLGSALVFLGASADTAAAGMVALNIAAGVIGAVIAVAMFAFTAHSDAVRADQQAVDDFTQALIRSNGAIDANVRETAYKHLVDSGAIDDAKALGLNLAVVTDAMLGNVPASRSIGAQMAALRDNTNLSSSAALIQAGHIEALSGVLGTSTGQFKSASQAQKDHAVATSTTNVALTSQEIAQQKVAATAGTTVEALAGAKDAQQKLADKAADAAAKMYLENDAAGILKGSLDLLNGKALSLMQAQTADADATNKVTASLKTNGTAINGNTVKAIANQQALQNKAAASQREAEAVATATGSTKAGTEAYKHSKTALENALRAQGKLTPAVQAYIDKLYVIKNLKVPPTKLDVDKAAAEAKIKTLQAKINAIRQGKRPGIDANSAAGKAAIAALQRQIDALHGKTVVINATTNAQAVANRYASGNAYRKAAGGLLKGPGTGTSDSIMGVDRATGQHVADVSTGEYVVNAKSTAANLGLLQSINAGAKGFKSGGQVGINVGLPPLDAIRNALTIRVQGGLPGAGMAGGGNARANQLLAASMLSLFGWGQNQMPSLISLWNGESGWNQNAHNASSGAHGIPQSLPASKMASAGSDYMTNPATQIRWGLGYIRGRYGSPSGAMSAWQARSPHWYGDGGVVPPGGMALNEPGGKPERILSGQQTESFDRMVAALERGQGDSADSSVVIAEIQGLRADIRALPKTYQMGQRQMAGAR